MRDEVIELIDVDATVFGDAPGGGSRPGDPARRRRKIVAFGVAVATAAATLALFNAKPWAGAGPRLELDDGHPGVSKLSEQLLLDVPVNQVRATTLHTTALPPSRNLMASGAIGYFFGDKGATFASQNGNARWFGFYATPVGAPGAPAVQATNEQIAGVPGTITTDPSGFSQLTWGPLDGYMYTAAAARLSKNEILTITDQLRVKKGKVEILNHAALGKLQPIGRFADYYALIQIAQRAQQNGVHQDGLVGVFYNTGGAIASMPANKSVTDMVPFVLGTSDGPPTLSTIHGHQAYGFLQGTGQFGRLTANVVLWWEGGRLILVSSSGTLDQTFALAATEHVASAADWAAVGTVN